MVPYCYRLEPRSPSYQADNSSVLLQEMSQLNSDPSDDDEAMESDLTKLIAGIERANSFTGKGYGSETALRMSREELERTDINALLSPIDTPAIIEEQTVFYLFLILELYRINSNNRPQIGCYPLL